MLRHIIAIALLALVADATLGSSSYFFPCDHPRDSQQSGKGKPKPNNQNAYDNCPTLNGIVYRAAFRPIFQWIGDHPSDFINALSTATTAAATVAVAIFTLRLWAVGRKQSGISAQQTAIMGLQADILTKQKEIARQQFIAEHRPRLRVRNIVIVPRTISGALFAGTQLEGRCYVENIGGAPATIVESHLEVYANQMGLAMESPYEHAAPNNVIKGAFNVGESRVFLFSQMSPLATEGEADRAFAGTHPLFVLGYVLYRDDSEHGVIHGVARRLAFCRRWDSGKRRFVPIDNDPDYEHDG